MWQSNIPYTDPTGVSMSMDLGTFTLQPNYAQSADPTIGQLGWQEDILFGGLTGMWENSLALPQQQPTQPQPQPQPQLPQPPQLQSSENQFFERHNEQRPYSLEVGPPSPDKRQLSPEIEPKDSQNLDELKIRVANLEETVSKLQVANRSMSETLSGYRVE